ncbi:PDGF- and VEGF-receptor related isoform X2 [Nomia melanderi]|uniref:PDGF- and VEGF-receptor related isoform X2 n=1 Tax=Nomia melanderi TaxID=2448451 RepID=UPI001303F954|nr:vascular endothelial growth factor receptor 1 isoform X2 [Nomia melanderi]
MQNSIGTMALRDENNLLQFFGVDGPDFGIYSTALRTSTPTEIREIIKNEGDPLEVECQNDDVIYFTYPISSGDKLNTSAVYINQTQDEDGTYRALLQRPETVYGDTGWYGCSDHQTTVTSPSDSDPYISWTYVYVQSKTNLFAENVSFETLHEISGGTVVIPCRPTSPNLTVKLETALHERVRYEESRITFDPRIGFILTNLTILDSEALSCRTELDGFSQEVGYYLNVMATFDLDEPKIIEDSVRHVTRGQTLYVNCTVIIDVGMQYLLDWSPPHQSSRITTRFYKTDLHDSGNRERITNELTIRNVTEEDEGYYNCTIRNYNNHKQTQKYIEVHDPQHKFINLTSQDPVKHVRADYDGSVQWVVSVKGYPQPRITWLNPKGHEITGTWPPSNTAKYGIKITDSKAVLKINHLSLDDSGVYSIQAINEDRSEILNFTLDVLTKPIPMLPHLKSYYAPNQEADVLCYVAAFPQPNITWSFIKCPNYPSCEGGETVTLMGTMVPIQVNSFRSNATIIIDSSGRLTCSACNSLGCDSATENLLVSDGNDGFGIIDPKEPVVEGDDLELICASSVYNYSSSFTWSDENDTSIIETNRLSIHKGQTQYTYRSILKIKNVRREDSKVYVCTGRTMDSVPESAQYHLNVDVARAPSFTEVNLQEKEMVIDFLSQGHKSVRLKCVADGMPKPNVTWYKDGAKLVTGEQFKCLQNNQVLVIEYLMESDSGKYSCRVENRVGKLEASQLITVKGKEQSIGLIVSIVIVVISALIMMIYFIIKIRREKTMRKQLIDAGLMHFVEGAVECLNPELTVDDQADLLPYDKKWEFPSERLKLGKQLGSGAFGVVVKAEAEGICEDEAVTTVAVKMVRRTTDATYVRALASELKIMIHLGKHLNVVNLLGACTKNISKRELLVIVEYCRFGNLHNYLLRHRSDFINQIDPATGKFDPNIGADLLTRTVSVCSNNSNNRNSATDSVQYQGTTADSQGVSVSPDGLVLSNDSTQPGWRSNYHGDYKDYNLKPICTQDLLSWAFQVARGMEYLCQRKVLHGDLAARNILLAENNIVKICDFGLAKSIYKDDNYKKKGDGPLPIKWLAIESIRDRIFSTQSDIWSFGIVLWEFFTLAETPYPGMEAEIQYQKLIEGYRMEQPEYATPEVYDIMLQCWKAKPTLRPSFTELVESIGDLLEESVRAHYISLNAPYLDMNTMLLGNGKNDYLTMLSAPDHAMLSSPTHEYVNSPVLENPGGSEYLCMSPRSQKNESGIFSPRPRQERSHFDFPSPTSDSEMSPMLKKVEDDEPYLKPINIHERRAEFARNWQARKNNQTEDRSEDGETNRDSGYCNTPRNLQEIDLNKKNNESLEKSEVNSNPTTKKDFTSPIIRTQDNYVNMPKQKMDLQKDLPDGFSNPSYVIMINRELDQTKV